jgi:hypothetical protein
VLVDVLVDVFVVAPVCGDAKVDRALAAAPTRKNISTSNSEARRPVARNAFPQEACRLSRNAKSPRMLDD